jgi:hypothetical protein
MAEIYLVLVAGRSWKISDINVPVCAAFNIIVHWFQECRVVLLALRFTASSQAAIKTTSMLPMIAHKTSNMHHTRPISRQQSEEEFGLYFALKCSVP